ncbi:MAG TPA: YchJ family metal-binding protein [Candidatus Accumulibacter phosphatis]|nr:hypothetical protein [Accumulibacter sp.]HCV13322.1 hypothetical protein [Accumulibacter sp.]HRL76066.1 YchJ family metal-binding protein [Candidatus Accumulibacter phosphatis]HRQ94478.1 YchJ family metal-binding protein [Candidatus Accumulibacter phosphatis]
MKRSKAVGNGRADGGRQAAAACPCGSQRPYGECCAPLHEGAAASDAAALMRSRYSAYALGREAYVLATWHPSTRPPGLDDAAAPRWLGLQIRNHSATGPDTASVEFVARYRVAGRGARLHEVSRFVREDGRWYYLDGEFPAVGG